MRKRLDNPPNAEASEKLKTESPFSPYSSSSYIILFIHSVQINVKNTNQKPVHLKQERKLRKK